MLDETVLSMVDIDKRFYGVHALKNFSFECRNGEVHVLMGENGAGKSTLLKAKLDKQGISAEVINVHTMKPLDKETILESVRKTGRVVTAENANVIGGLYSAVCDLLATEYPVRVERVGVEDLFGEVGSLDDLAERYGLTEESIIRKCNFLF